MWFLLAVWIDKYSQAEASSGNTADLYSTWFDQSCNPLLCLAQNGLIMLKWPNVLLPQFFFFFFAVEYHMHDQVNESIFCRVVHWIQLTQNAKIKLGQFGSTWALVKLDWYNPWLLQVGSAHLELSRAVKRWCCQAKQMGRVAEAHLYKLYVHYHNCSFVSL